MASVQHSQLDSLEPIPEKPDSGSTTCSTALLCMSSHNLPPCQTGDGHPRHTDPDTSPPHNSSSSPPRWPTLPPHHPSPSPPHTGTTPTSHRPSLHTPVPSPPSHPTTSPPHTSTSTTSPPHTSTTSPSHTSATSPSHTSTTSPPHAPTPSPPHASTSCWRCARCRDAPSTGAIPSPALATPTLLQATPLVEQSGAGLLLQLQGS